jgi:hypothetical protein
MRRISLMSLSTFNTLRNLAKGGSNLVLSNNPGDLQRSKNNLSVVRTASKSLEGKIGSPEVTTISSKRC